VDNRRRIHRQPIGWAASYQMADEVALSWRDCRVVDISMLGMGITLARCESSDLVGRLISVNLPGAASSVNVRLEGEIKSAVPTINRRLRIGIEFTELSEAEQAITAVLSVMSDVLVSS